METKELAEELLKLETKSLSDRIAEATSEDIPDILLRLKEIKSETERAIYIESLSKKLKVPGLKRAIQRDLKITNNSKTDEAPETITAYFPGLIDLVTNENGDVAFLILVEDTLLVETVWEINGNTYVPPEKSMLPFELSKAEEVIKWYELNNDQKLFEDVIAYLKRFAYLPDKQWLIIACKIFLTYIQDHPDIHYFPMILFYAVPERGKSRTGKAAIYIAYRGVHCVDLREANLFRFAQDLKATLFLDIMDIWKKAEKNGSEDILLLRCEKGAKATRVIYPEKGAFKDTVYYSVSGPTFIATNQPVHKILDTRCILNTMPNKPGNYENPTPENEKAQELKERLTAWRARVTGMLLPEIEHIQELNGRLWDISKPLLQVCKLVYPEGFDSLKNALFEVAGQRLEDRKASIEGQIISILDELSPGDIPEWSLKTSEVLNKINDKRPEAHKLTSQYLGRKLKAMGIQTKIVMGYSEIRLKKVAFDVLLLQYGIIDSQPSEKTLLNSTTLSEQELSTVYDSRELVESDGNSTETLLTESLENKGFEGFVESSRELQGKSKKPYFTTLEVDK